MNKKSLKYYKENKKKRIEYQKKLYRLLNEFANKHCKTCGKLLSHTTTSGYCFEHCEKSRKKKHINEIQ